MRESGSWIVRAWGAAAVLLYGLLVGVEAQGGRPENSLWACHLATASVGLGLLFHVPTAVGIGFLWLLLGVPLWFLAGPGLDMSEPVSAAAHLGGLGIGLWAVGRLGLPRPLWWRAAAALGVLHVVCRFSTPAEANVNLAFRVWPGWESVFQSHATYILTIAAASCVFFWSVESLLRRAGLMRPLERL